MPLSTVCDGIELLICLQEVTSCCCFVVAELHKQLTDKYELELSRAYTLCTLHCSRATFIAPLTDYCALLFTYDLTTLIYIELEYAQSKQHMALLGTGVVDRCGR